MFRFNLTNSSSTCEYFPFIRGNFGQQTLASEFVGCGFCFVDVLPQLFWQTADLEHHLLKKALLLKAFLFFQVYFECVWENRWENAQLGQQEAWVLILCVRNWATLVPSVPRDLLHVGINMKNLIASILLQSWKLMFSHVSVTASSNFSVLVASLQSVACTFKYLSFVD